MKRILTLLLIGWFVLASTTVAVSIRPLYLLARDLVPGNIGIFTVVPPGYSPHIFSPSPSAVRKLSSAKLIFVIGAGLEFWLDDVKENLRGRIVVLSEGMDLLGEDGRVNPHVWLSPERALKMVDRMIEALKKEFPERASEIDAKGRSLRSRIVELDREIRRRTASFRNRKVVVYHPAWTYFLRDYGLEQVAVIERKPGEAPTPRRLASIIKIIKEEKVKLIITEPGPQERFARILAERAGVRLAVLDPLATSPDIKDYCDFIMQNFKKIEEVLGDGG